MKIKTSELIGRALNWAVAVCEGEQIWTGMGACERICPDTGTKEIWETTTDWDQGGPIILDHEISIIKLYGAHDVDSNGDATGKRTHVYGAVIGCCFEDERLRNSYGKNEGSIYYIDTWRVVKGPTPLIAAMRCLVASKLGDEVDVPEELT
jgi:hypothetical protein